MDLGDSDWIGTLSELPVRRAGLETKMVLSSFVYDLGEARPTLHPSDEVAEAYWIPLDHLWNLRNEDRLIWSRGTGPKESFPAIGYRDQLIWGLSLRVLTLFADAIGRPLPVRVTAL